MRRWGYQSSGGLQPKLQTVTMCDYRNTHKHNTGKPRTGKPVELEYHQSQSQCLKPGRWQTILAAWTGVGNLTMSLIKGSCHKSSSVTGVGFEIRGAALRKNYWDKNPQNKETGKWKPWQRSKLRNPKMEWTRDSSASWWAKLPLCRHTLSMSEREGTIKCSYNLGWW